MEWLEEQEFYELMQAYRHAPVTDQSAVVAAFEAVKQAIRDLFQERDERPDSRRDVNDRSKQPQPADAGPVERHVRQRAMWSSGLQCGWTSWTVVDDGILRLDMPADNCCDMTGAVKAAEALCPLVWRIDTYAGGQPDAMYLLRDSQWGAVDQRAARTLYATYPAA